MIDLLASAEKMRQNAAMLAAGQPLDCSPVVLAREQPFRIGKAEFRPATREVSFAGKTEVIEPRVMQLLVALRRAEGRLISKVDLADLVWESRIVGDDAIHRVVSRLRSVAEKHAGNEFQVETVKKVGYRIVRSAGSIASSAVGGRIGRRELMIGGGGLLAAGVAGVGWFVLRSDQTPFAARQLVDNARKSLRQADLGDEQNAIGMLREATRIAPKSAEAWGLLAFALMAGATNATAQDRPDLRARAMFAMTRAFRLQPYQADALAAQIHAFPMYRNWYRYEQACRAALGHHPDHPELIVELARMLAEVGRLNESLAMYERARSAMPLSAELLVARPVLLWSLGRLDEADAAIGKAFELLPRNYEVWTIRAFYLMYTGRPREAAAMFADTEARPAFAEQDEEYRLNLMQANAIASGDRTQILEAVDTLVKFAESGKGFVLAGALFASYAGEVDQAFRLLEALYLDRGLHLPSAYFARANSSSGGERRTLHLFTRPMASIRRDPRFAALTREIGLDQYWQQSNSLSRVTI